MIPGSRLSPEQREEISRRNLKQTPYALHMAWHEIFGNMTPFEAIICVVTCLAPEGYFKKAKIKASFLGAKYYYNLRNPRMKRIEKVENYRPPKSLNTALRKVFFGRNWVNIVSEIASSWSPEGYFREIVVVGGDRLQVTTFVLKQQRHHS